MGVIPVLNNLHKARAFTNLQVHLGLVLSERWNAGKERLSLHPGLGQYEQQRANKGQVSEQELQVPQDAVRYRLNK